MKSDKYIGVDIGGTSIKIGFMSREGDFLAKWQIPMPKNVSGERVLSTIWDSIKVQMIKEKMNIEQFQAIGVGSAGFVDPKSGVVKQSVNIGWKNFPIKEIFERLTKLPVVVDNDANIAALGEIWKGAATGERDIVMITLGTGVGGGIIVDGKIVSGNSGTAGEIGHIIVDPDGDLCNCGRRGCLETIVSATGIRNLALKIAKLYPNSLIADYFNQKGDISATNVFAFAKEGDQASNEVIDKVADILGRTIANISAIINPSKVLLGGGVSNAGDQLRLAVENKFNQYALQRVKESCKIEIAQLKNDAGIIGAVYLARTMVP